VANIFCPACQSEIGSDGKSLINRSSYLTDLENAADTFEKKLAELEREREAEAKKHEVEPVEKRREAWRRRLRRERDSA